MPSNNVPVNGWPQLKLLDKVQPILNELDKIERWQKSVKLVTRSGNVVTVPNALALDAQSLKVTFAPIQSGSGDPSPSNVRPISGHTGASATIYTGDNMLDPTTEVQGYYIDDNGVPTSDTLSKYSALIAVEPGNHIMGMYVSITTSGNKRIHGYDANGNWVRQLAIATAPHAALRVTLPFTVTSDIAFIRLSHYKTDKNVQIEKGTTANVYKAYKGQTHTTPFGSTYYDGYVDVVSGELVVTHSYAEYDGSEDENWDKSYSSYWADGITLNNKAKGDIITNQYKGVKINQWTELQDGEIALHPTLSNNIVRCKNENGGTLAEFKAALAVTPLTVCYELATPIRIALTPEQVTMFTGYNTTYADIGPIEIVLYTGDSWS